MLAFLLASLPLEYSKDMIHHESNHFKKGLEDKIEEDASLVLMHITHQVDEKRVILYGYISVLFGRIGV